MVKKLVSTGGLIFLLSLLLAAGAQARVYFSNPTIGDWVSTDGVIERGASFTIDVIYNKSDAGATDFVIDSAGLYIQYDTTRLESPVLIAREGANALGGGAGLNTLTGGIIQFEKFKRPGSTDGINMAGRAEVVMYGVKFHLLESAASGGPFTNLVFWPTSEPHSIRSLYFLVLASGDHREGTLPAAAEAKNLSIADPLPPIFSGLAVADGHSGNSATADNNIGNTITLNWSSHVTADLDLRESGGHSTQTRYDDGRLGYNIYRNPGDAAFTPAAGNRKATFITGTRGNMGDYIYKDGLGTGVPDTSLGPNAVSDCFPYSYIVRVQDACSPNHEELNTSREVVISHDFVAPSTPADFTIAATNEALILSWRNPPEPDFGGVVLVRKTGAYPNPTYNDASGMADGTAPPSSAGSAPPGDTGATVVYVGTGDRFVDTGRSNGTYYYYRLYAYDRAVPGAPPTTPKEQGYNWSDPAQGSRAPGVPASVLRNFIAISSPEVGQLTLYWDKPSESWYGGAIFWYTTDFTNKWDWYKSWGEPTSNAIDRLDDNPRDWTDLKDADPGHIGILAVFKTNASTLPGQQERMLITSDTAGNLLDLRKVYLIKGLAYNATGVDLPTSASAVTEVVLRGHRFSDERMAAALPAGSGGGAAVRFPYTLYASRSDRLVVNSITIPPGMGIRTAPDLVRLINEKAGHEIVKVIGKWDPETGKSIGYKPLPGGGFEGREFSLTAGEGYQLYINDAAGPTVSISLP
jgi:hypothetical protein